MPAPPKPSLQTIADLLGVSRATVSLALRNQSCISEATRIRVRAAAEEIGYRPNPMVSTLMAHIKSLRPVPDAGVIAFLTAFKTRDGWKHYQTLHRYHTGAAERARLAGYRLEEHWLKEPGMTSRKMQSILYNRGVEGILVCPLPGGAGHLSLDLTSFAAAAVGHTLTRPKLHRAVTHSIEAVRETLHQLRHLGYRRIAMTVEESHDRRNSFYWTSAYCGYQQTRPLRQRIPMFFTAPGREEDFQVWLRKWKPDALISGSSQVFGLLEKMGLSAPADLGVAVLDRAKNDDGIAGIDQMPEVVGSAAVDLIVAQIQRNERGIPAQAKLMCTEGVWVMGPSLRQVNSREFDGAVQA